MRAKVIIKYIGIVLLFNAVFLYISAFISVFLHESSITPLFYPALMCTILGIFPFIFVEKVEEISYYEGLGISVLGWIFTCVVGMIPYFMWGGEFSLAGAFFESVSGYTTTGATVLNNVEALTKGLLFWRASTHFIGGLGIILFVLLLLPDTKGMRSSLYKSEVSWLSMLNFKMKTKQIAHTLLLIYFSLIILQIILLKIAGMSWFDSICHSFATVATGGLSTKNLSIAYYDSVPIEVIIMIFMLLGSMHFGLIFGTVTGKKNNIFTSKIAKSYLLVIAIGILLVTINLTYEHYYSFWKALRYASFQVITLATTTGFATVDTPNWPIFSILVLIYFSIQCGMVGSTAGGVKFDRIYVFFRSLSKQIKLSKHPNALFAIKADDAMITQEMELQVVFFIVLYLLTLGVVTLVLAAMKIDGMTAFSASVATIGNVGPGFGSVHSMGNYAGIPDAGKYVLSANMLLGRLEIMNIIVFLGLLSGKKR